MQAMQTLKTEGIILKRRNFGEADRILTVFSPQMGKISVMAKGVRRITSRRGGNVELLNRSSAFLHKGKSFWILTEAVTIDPYTKIKSDLTLSTYAFHILELIDKLTAEDQENYIVYNHLLNVLEKLSNNPRQIFIRAFEVKTLSTLGFLSFQNPDVSIQFHIGGRMLELLVKLEQLSWDDLGELSISQEDASELERILRFNLEKVIEGSLKSRQYLKKT